MSLQKIWDIFWKLGKIGRETQHMICYRAGDKSGVGFEEGGQFKEYHLPDSLAEIGSRFPGTVCGRWRLRQRGGVVREAVREDL